MTWVGKDACSMCRLGVHCGGVGLGLPMDLLDSHEHRCLCVLCHIAKNAHILAHAKAAS